MSAALFTAAEQSILPLLPMIYVAWADGELTDDELNTLRQALPGPDDALQQWLDPTQPPDATRLADLLRRLQAAAADVGLPQRHDLIGLGLSIAGLSESDWAEERAAVQALETALGLYGRAASARFFPPAAAPALPPPPDWTLAAMTALLDGANAAWKERVRQQLNDPFFRHPGEINSAEYRALVLRWCQTLADNGFLDSLLPAAKG